MDKLKPATKAWDDRQARWRHNAFSGHVAMMKANLNSMIQSPTTTDQTKRLALRLYENLQPLVDSLKIRKSP